MPTPRPCRRCGHPYDVHAHLRPGSDCSRCDCPAYRGGSWLGRLLAALRGRSDGRGAARVAVLAAVALGLGLLAPTGGAAVAGQPLHRATAHAPTKKVTTAKATTARIPLGISYGDRLTWMSDADLARALDDAVALHATWIRTDLSWYDLQPSSAQQTYLWARTDRVVTAARARGLKVLGVLGYTPAWARVPGCGAPTCPPASNEAFARFATAVARRYAGSVAAYEIWNEENVPGFWRSPDPAAYAALLRLAAPAVRRAAPASTVLLGGLASNKGLNGAIRPSAFVARVCATGACAAVDAIAYHPYTYPYAASLRTTWHTPWERMTVDSAGDVSLKTASVGSALAGKPVWVTEFGAPTGGRGGLADGSVESLRRPTDHVTEALQATIVADGIRTAKADAGVGALFLYTDRDLARPTGNDGYYGLRRSDGTAKPAYAAAARAFAGS